MPREKFRRGERIAARQPMPLPVTTQVQHMRTRRRDNPQAQTPPSSSTSVDNTAPTDQTVTTAPLAAHPVVSTYVDTVPQINFPTVTVAESAALQPVLQPVRRSHNISLLYLNSQYKRRSLLQ